MQQTRYMTLVDRPYGYWTLDEDEMKRFKYWMTYNPIHTPEPLTPFSGWYYAACPFTMDILVPRRKQVTQPQRGLPVE